MKLLIAAAIAFFSLFFTATAAPAQDWAPATAKVAPAVVLLRIAAPSLSGICSAVVVAPKTIAANAHCVPVDEDRSFAVDHCDAELRKFNRILDLAILSVKCLDVAPVDFSDKEMVAGLPTAIAGYALRASVVRFQYGHVSDAAGDESYTGPLVDAQIFPGDSGGAMFDVDGHVLTLSRGYLGMRGSPQTYAVGVSPKALREYVKQYLASPAPKIKHR